MDWKDAASQWLRFAILCDVCDLNGKCIHEVGAGAGHLLDFLDQRRIAADYSGSDLSAAMVDAAHQRHPKTPFSQWDILAESQLPTFDVLMCSGLFHVKLDHDESVWRSFVWAMVRRMYELCKVGIAFNMITDQVDFKIENLYYSNPGETVDFCRRQLSRFVTLRHDYPLHEYTVYVYRNDAV